MPELIVRFTDRPREEPCALCGKPLREGVGPQLCLAAGLAAVCLNCGRCHAPALCALLDLARVAETVGRVSPNRRLWVPQEMLLTLLGASEDYSAVIGSGKGDA